MSLVDQYQFQPTPAQRAAASAALEARRLELARLQLERCQIAAAATDRQLRSAQAAAVRAQAGLRQAEQRASRVDAGLRQTRAQLEQARHDLSAQICRVEGLQSTAATETRFLAAALDSARRSLDDLSTLGSSVATGQQELGSWAAETEELRRRGVDLDRRIQTEERELRFLQQRQDLTPAALVTLQAMAANGYELRDTISQQGLVAYFQRAGEKHQIAVRMAPLPSRETEEGWELLAETFGLTGPRCLEELEDFEAAVETLDLGLLESRGSRVYPKDEGSARASLRGVLPKPRRHAAAAPAKTSGERQGQR